MKRRSNLRARVLIISYRPVAARVAVFLMLIASVWLIAASKTQNGSGTTLRAFLADNVSPVISALAKPIDSFYALQSWMDDILVLREENKALKAENARLREEFSAAVQLKNENERLRALLKFAPPDRPAYTSARVTVDSGSPYSNSVLIAAGYENGVREDSAVINDKGIIGRVVEVGKKTSRILLLSDINSRIPVMAENSREHAIAAGDASDNLTLLYTPENSKIKVGDKIVTSGDGAVIPPGLPVGVVSKIQKNSITVKPFADWYRLEYVSVIDF